MSLPSDRWLGTGSQDSDKIGRMRDDIIVTRTFLSTCLSIYESYVHTPFNKTMYAHPFTHHRCIDTRETDRQTDRQTEETQSAKITPTIQYPTKISRASKYIRTSIIDNTNHIIWLQWRPQYSFRRTKPSQGNRANNQSSKQVGKRAAPHLFSSLTKPDQTDLVSLVACQSQPVQTRQVSVFYFFLKRVCPMIRKENIPDKAIKSSNGLEWLNLCIFRLAWEDG